MKKVHLPLMPVIWGVTCLLIGTLVAIGLHGYYSAEKAMARQFNTQQLMMAQQAARGIENFFTDIRETADLLTRTPEIQTHEAGMREKTLQTLGKSFHVQVSFLYLQNHRGEFISVTRKESFKGIDKGDLEVFFHRARQTGKPLVELDLAGKPSRGKERSAFVLAVAPIFRNSEFGGALGCAFSLDEINERFIHPIRSGASGGAWLINQDGVFIAHYDKSLQGRDAFAARKERDGNLSTERIDRIMREEMLRGKSGIDEYTSGWHRGVRGKIRKLIAYAPIRMDDQIWSVAVVTPYSDVTQVVWGSFKNSALLLIIMAGTLLTGTYVGHKINQGRVRAEEKVRWGEEVLKSQNRLQALFDGAPDAIIIVDRKYQVSMINKTALTWYTREAKDFAGKICYQVFQGRSDLCPNCPAEEVFRTGQPAFRERASLVASGKKRYLQIFNFPLRDRHGVVEEVVEYVKDVTAEKELQQKIIQAERLAVVGRMSANVAHEIKNPLGTIVLNADLLEEELDRFTGQDTTEARSVVGVIKSELDHLIDVVEEYLQFARLPQVRLDRGDVNEVISDLLLFLKEEASDRKIMVVEELQPMLPPVQLDGKQLRQALLNIVKNSLEAMPNGGKLSVTTAGKDEGVEITISDTGRGISEEDTDMIFTPFFSTKHGGTGLGLPITVHILQEHHGSVTFESHLDLGTTFTIRLPAMPDGPVKEEGRQDNGWPGDNEFNLSRGEKGGNFGPKEYSTSR